MFKVYHGIAAPLGHMTRFTIDWRCPVCHSEHVARDPLDLRELRYCDGGPATEDELRFWVCDACGHRTLGHQMETDYKKLKLTAEEQREERRRLDARSRWYQELLASMSREDPDGQEDEG